MALANKVIYQNGAIKKFEKPEVCEAIKVANANRWTVALSPTEWDQREARLKYEYEKSTKAPGPGEEQPVEKSSSVPHTGLVYDQNFEVERLRQENKDLLKVVEKMKEGNPALKEAASKFNDALLAEQADKIKRLGKEISRLNKVIHKKNLKIEELKKESSERLAGKVKLYGETVDLSQELCDKNEELRLTKIREKNLAELGLKYVGENEKLKKELADKVVDKIDAQALKSAESALAWKEKVVTYKDMSLAYYEKKIAEKDEVIADLGKELAAQKGLKDEISLKYIGVKRILKLRRDECEKLKEELEEANNRIKAIHNASKEYCEYGIAAEKMIQKMAKAIVGEKPICSEDFEEYRRWANGYRFNPQLYDFIEEEEKKLEHAKKIRVSSDNAEEGADLYGVILLCGKDYIDALKKAKDADIWQE